MISLIHVWWFPHLNGHSLLMMVATAPHMVVFSPLWALNVDDSGHFADNISVPPMAIHHYDDAPPLFCCWTIL
ncbi:hypothetical protein EV424DRAFT_1539314 [Suillus variegatus]|nr:hypothetical protein EV424DRAFT_1539314 [Suillus variegatus]